MMKSDLMFFRSIRKHICFSLLMRFSACYEALLPTVNDADELQNVVDLKRRAHDLVRAADAAAEDGDWQVVPELETRRQAVDEELKEALRRWLAELEAHEIEIAMGQPNLQRRLGHRLFATQARLNFAFANLYMRLSANHER